ncbi:LOW QUALITY PROTEIN: protein G1-like9 [Nematostella vectensis]|uniref:LOW QUALITY PROTEIN: protein G1-like9 n=1 Tax=Nematostella vectensis TaxID=45351 RepID=UPI002076F924|nr:LOW QUALITY PROTEIN: protein G1-like9 [Nematostella vectensis]
MSCPSYPECGSRRFNAPSVATPTMRYSPFVSAVAAEETEQDESKMTKVPLNLEAIENRLDDLRGKIRKKPYQKQKSSLQVEFERFLYSLPSKKTLTSASPSDITRFLVYKDRKGRTKVHTPKCNYFGSTSKSHCACPNRLAAGTVDSTIGKLRSIFIEFPKQAVPIFFDKMAQLCAYLKSPVFSPSCTAPQRYTYVRDMAFFCLDFYTGDRGSDLGRVFTKEVALLPDKQGFLFRHTFGKTLRGGGKSNTFQIKKVFRQQGMPRGKPNRLYKTM